MYDVTCMTQNWLSNFYGVYTIILVVHTKFIKVVLKDYSAFKSSNKLIQEQVGPAVIIALISEKKKSMKKRKKKRRVCMKPWLKGRKNLEFYVCRIYLIFDLACRTAVKRRTCSQNWPFINREVIQELWF